MNIFTLSEAISEDICKCGILPYVVTHLSSNSVDVIESVAGLLYALTLNGKQFLKSYFILNVQNAILNVQFTKCKFGSFISKLSIKNEMLWQ